MSKEYQSEKSPIFDSHKSPKTQRKLHIMFQLYASEVYQMFCNTRYVYIGVEGEGGDDNIVTDGAQPPVPSIYYLQYPLSTGAVTTVCTPHTSVMR